MSSISIRSPLRDDATALSGVAPHTRRCSSVRPLKLEDEVSSPSFHGLGALQKGDVILFTGDSITDAFRKPEELNIAYQLGAGYAMLIGARLMSEFPGADFRFENRGISGQRITQLEERWERDCLDLAPNVVSILIGVNSTLGKFRDPDPPVDADFDSFYNTYDCLLKRLAERRPGVRLVLCEPFMLPCGMGAPELLQDIRVRAECVRRLAKNYSAIFVPFQSVFDAALARASAEYWAYDGIHPTAAGFWLMAETWLKHITEAS